jgi:hypothetical protein
VAAGFAVAAVAAAAASAAIAASAAAALSEAAATLALGMKSTGFEAITSMSAFSKAGLFAPPQAVSNANMGARISTPAFWISRVVFFIRSSCSQMVISNLLTPLNYIGSADQQIFFWGELSTRQKLANFQQR